MKITRETLCAGIILFFTITAYAEEVQVLKWKECVREAVNNNPELISAKEELNQAEADKKITQSSMLPKISAELISRRSETAESRSKTDSHSLAITGNQLLYDASKTSMDVK